MKSIATFAALILIGAAATVPVAAQSLGEKSGVNSALNISPTSQDFVREAASSDMFEIESSKLAVQKTSGATKTFATQMVADHTKTSNELKGLAKGMQIPPTMSSAYQKMLDRLKSQQGNDDFAKQYRDDQVAAHEEAVSLFERYAKGGDNDQLKAWAAKTLPALQHHHKMAQDLSEK